IEHGLRHLDPLLRDIVEGGAYTESGYGRPHRVVQLGACYRSRVLRSKLQEQVAYLRELMQRGRKALLLDIHAGPGGLLARASHGGDLDRTKGRASSRVARHA